MAAYAAVISLMNNLDQIKNHPHFSTSFDKNQIQFLGQTLDFLLDFIENCKYSDGGIIIEETEELESQIASTAHEAEDIIESYIVDQILGGSTELITPFTTLQKVLQDMDSIKNNVLKVKEDRDIVDHEKRKSSTPVATSTSTGKSSNYMVGFADELYQLKDVLTGQQSSLQIISIVGMGGAGKTSLAKHVYETSIIREHFDIRNWVTISQEYDVREILLGLLSIKGKPIDATVHGLGHQLYKSLFGRRYLIILDDVWSVEVWNEIKCFFPNNENGSRVVLTTRLTNLATSLGTLCFYLNFLDECESWDLFCEKAFGQEECPDELMGIGKKIVERCKGLPLSIVVIGGLLRKSHRTVEYWKNVERNINSVLNSRENGQCLDALYLSYSHLPAHLKPCFLYMGVYREDYKIRVSKMIKLWVAEGFLKPNGVQMLEVIANDYVKDLIDRNLILVCENGSNGKVKSCRMHDLVRDLCLRVASKEKFFSVVMANSIPGGIDRERRLTFHDDHSVYDVLPSSSIARSMICNEVVIIPPKCRLLRVLSSEVVADCIETEFHNFNLRCLDFLVPQTNSKLLPSSISRIWNLQTLIIRNGAYNVVDMTLGIWKMGQLRHLKGFRIYLPDPPQSKKDDDSVVLRSLQTLKGVVNFRLSKEACKRIPNIKKLHLMYGVLWNGNYDGLYHYLRNLGCLHKLESLKIWSLFGSRISNNGLNNVSFPSSINKLTLGGDIIHWQDLSMITASLPQLQVLKLSILGEGEWSCVEGGFPYLKLLQIEYANLESWSLESSLCFPVLEKLVLMYLSYLKAIPLEFGEVPTLQLIRLLRCTKSTENSAKKIKEEQESYGNDDLVLQVLKSKYKWY